MKTEDLLGYVTEYPKDEVKPKTKPIPMGQGILAQIDSGNKVTYAPTTAEAFMIWVKDSSILTSYTNDNK